MTSDGFAVTYELFDGNRNDVTTLDEIVDAVPEKHSAQRRKSTLQSGPTWIPEKQPGVSVILSVRVFWE